MTEFKRGDKVRAYGHKHSTEPEGEEWYYKFEQRGYHAVSKDNVNFGLDRLFSRVEKVVDVVVPKRGDKVRVYDHCFKQVPDGTIGTYREHQEGYSNPHCVDFDGKYGNGRSFGRVEVVGTVNEVEDYKYKVLLPMLDKKQAIHQWPQHEYDQVLKDLDITRPLPDLPKGNFALVVAKGERGEVKLVRRRNGDWNVIEPLTGSRWDEKQIQENFVRTIFEGEK